jgi:NADH:ubiquinone oxidoreductase subunit K
MGPACFSCSSTELFNRIGYFTVVDRRQAVEIIFAVEGNMNAFALRKQNTSN